jgi:YVTN family beta-propeller protein
MGPSVNAKSTLALLLLAASGCGLLTPRSVARAPLETEGEVLLYLQPWPGSAERLEFKIASVSAIRSDGAAVPLELLISELPGSEAERQRLLARGRLPPGTYRALDVKVSRATVMSPDGPAQLLVGGEPAGIQASFQVRAQRANVLSLTLQYEGSVQADYAFSPRFAVVEPSHPIPQLHGAVTNADTSDLTLFDKHRHDVAAVVPTGREPQGVVLGPGLSRMYVAVSGDDQVAVYDLITLDALPAIRLTVGDRPRELAASPDGRVLLVLNGGSNSLAFIDPSSGSELGRVPTGSAPVALLVDRSFRRAYVLNEMSSSMTVVDIATRTVAKTVATDPSPVRAQLNRAGDRLYVVHGASPQMLVFSLPDVTIVNRISVGLGATALKIDPRSDMIYLARRDDRRLYVYDAFSLIPIDFFDVPGGVTWLTIDDTENTLLALMPSRGEVAVIDLPSRRLVGLVPVGEEPYMVTVAAERL